MNNNFINAIAVGVGYAAIFVIAEVWYHYLKPEAEITRKFVHIAGGLCSLLFPLLFSSHWYVLTLAVLFFILLLSSKKLGFFPSINKIDRPSTGSLGFPAALYISFAAYSFFDKPLYFYLPVLILTICDPAACLSGKKWPMGRYRSGSGTKTLTGSMVFFLLAFIITAALLNSFYNADFIICAAYAFVFASFTTGAEALSGYGFDNLSIPLTVLVLMVAMNF